MKKNEPKSKKNSGTHRQLKRDVPKSAESIANISRVEAARLATFPKLNPNPIAELDFAGEILYLNPAAERLFPDLRQRGTGHLWLADWESLVNELREGETKVIIREIRVGARWCQQTLQLVEETKRIHIYGIDITERVMAEDALRHSEARYRSVFHDSSAPMLLIDPATAEIVDANPAACRYYDYTHTELKAKKITDINVLTHEQIFEEMKRAKARELRSFEFSHRLASGEIRPVEVFSGPIDLEGRVLLLSIVHDITERKRAEMALNERTAQLEAANKELESFSYSVSHDLRAPLRAIDGYARMILKKQADTFDEDTLRKFNDIRLNAKMMGHLIDDLLAFSRLGRKHMSIEKLDMNVLIGDVWKELTVINPERDITLAVNDLPSSHGDRALMKQVYANLLSNAIKFTKNRDAAGIEVGGHADGTKVIYYVRDNGVGFDMTYYDKLFGVFQRLHSTDDFEGTGIGLALVKRIIDRHGGRVWAEGIVGEGAVFYFSLHENRESYLHT
ncbi:MAG: sensor histidine kinase [Syntrophales bacterium]